MTEIVAEISQQARRSPHINQRSGVSVRLSIANYETLVANATRRALRHGENEVVPRVSDLDALVASAPRARSSSRPSTTAARSRCSTASSRPRCSRRSARRARPEKLDRARRGVRRRARGAHRRGRPVVGVRARCSPTCPGCATTLADLDVGETPAGVASAVEFVLEGLHLSKRLNKDAVGGKAAYRGRG